MKIKSINNNIILSAMGNAKKMGFALIATLMIMALLVILAFVMLSLSNTTTRSTNVTAGTDQAKANARMALMMAIGELQMSSGADTRITASADLLTPGAPPVLGVWRSWEGTNHDADGRPIAPNYGVKTLPSTDSDSRFIGYMVSGASSITDPASADLANLVFSAPEAATVPLLAAGSIGTNPGQVHIQPLLLETGDEPGAYAWWVSGENQKARLSQPYKPRTDDEYGWSTLAKSHAVPDLAYFGLEEIADDPEEFRDGETGQNLVKKSVSRKTMDLLKDNNILKPHERFHDYSSSAVGLLTNTATGGWRKDLSLLSERWTDIYAKYPGGRLPLFRYAPLAGATSAAARPTGPSGTVVFDPPQSSLYPWSGYVQYGTRKVPFSYTTAAGSWLSMVNFINSYKTINIDSSLTMPNSPITWDKNLGTYGNPANSLFYAIYHQTDYQPIVARYQMIVQVNALPDPLEVSDPAAYGLDSGGNPTAHFYRLNMRIVPAITLWNPYNIELTRNSIVDIGLDTSRSLPTVLSIINGTHPPVNGHAGNYKFINGGNNLGIDSPGSSGYIYDYQISSNITKTYTQSYFGNNIRSIASWMPRNFTLKPGEVKVFTPGFNAYAISQTIGIRLKEGYAVSDDFGLTRVDPTTLPTNANGLIRVATSLPNKAGTTNQLHKNHLLKFAVKADRHSKNYTDNISPLSGAGTFFTIGASQWPALSTSQFTSATYEEGGVPKGVQHARGIMATSVNDAWAQKYWPATELEEVQYPVSEIIPESIEPGNGNPEWTNIFSINFGPRLTFGAGYNNVHNRPTKGVLQSNPFAQNTLSIPEQQATFHPANGVYDMSYQSMQQNSFLSPEVGNSGYIVSGFQSGEGLSRLIMAEIPLAPLASLAELQSWNLRGSNPLPPHQYNLIGNSDATPMIASDSAVINSPALIRGPDPLNTLPVVPTKAQIVQHDDAYCANHLLFDDWFFSTLAPQPSNFGNTITKTIDIVYRDFLLGTDMLTNRAYRTIPEDTKLTGAKAAALITEIITTNSGGNNWLKIASRFEVDGMFNVNSTSVKAWRALLGHAQNRQVAYYSANGIDLDTTERDHVISRNTVASDVAAGAATGAGAIFDNGSEYAGFRSLSNAQLDELAEKIVEQVRLRGPFLSLSEFVNRQLSTNEDLAIAGALQVALDSLTDDPNQALKDASKELSDDTMDPDGAKLDGSAYAFKKAAEGYSTHGFPGWIRQADILRPLAPIMSARDDTFTIRAYGDVRDDNGNILAQAWCEATVRRTREFVDIQDAADRPEPPTSVVNQTYGRKYVITSFRWLNPDEV